MKNLLLSIALSAVVSSCAVAKPVNITVRNAETYQKKNSAKRIINVHASAMADAINWCRTSGGLKYISIDPNKNYLYKYVCRESRQTPRSWTNTTLNDLIK